MMITILRKNVRALWLRANEQPKRLLFWYMLGLKSTPPPDLFKQQFVKRFGRQFNVPVFIETGTYHGDMTATAALVFAKVYSIEIHQPFYERAVGRFAGNPTVKIIKGDSATALRTLLPQVTQPALFWLDAHGGKSARLPDGSEAPAPVRSELTAILAHPLADQHVILVDDVHTFVRGTKWGVGVWAEIEAVRESWLKKHPDWIWKVKDNILMIYKPRDGIRA